MKISPVPLSISLAGCREKEINGGNGAFTNIEEVSALSLLPSLPKDGSSRRWIVREGPCLSQHELLSPGDRIYSVVTIVFGKNGLNYYKKSATIVIRQLTFQLDPMLHHIAEGSSGTAKYTAIRGQLPAALNPRPQTRSPPTSQYLTRFLDAAFAGLKRTSAGRCCAFAGQKRLGKRPTNGPIPKCSTACLPLLMSTDGSGTVYPSTG